MPVFLHRRITSEADIHRLFTDRVCEYTLLDYKQQWWTDGDEACKDVVALANASGGDIIVGIQEANSQPNGFLPKDLQKRPKDPQQTLQTWLHGHCRPEQVANTIEVTELAAEQGSLLVISVPPWPHGVVGVRKASNQPWWSFPYREGSHTRFWDWEEVLMRSDAQARAAYLKTAELAGRGLTGVAIASPLLVREGTKAANFFHGGVDKSSQARLQGTPVASALTIEMCFTAAPHRVTIGWGLVRDVWEDANGNIALALAADLILDTASNQKVWRLEYRR